MNGPLSTDPLWVPVGQGRSVRIPYRPAAAWLDLLPTVNHSHVLLLADPDPSERKRLRDLVLDGHLSGPDIERASHDLLSKLTCAPQWWVGWNIAVIGSSAYTVGAMTLKGADPFRCTLAQWNAAVEHLYTQGADEAGKMRWMAATSMPPADASGSASWDSGMSAEQMTAMAARMPGMG